MPSVSAYMCLALPFLPLGPLAYLHTGDNTPFAINTIFPIYRTIASPTNRISQLLARAYLHTYLISSQSKARSNDVCQLGESLGINQRAAAGAPGGQAKRKTIPETEDGIPFHVGGDLEPGKRGLTT